MKALLLRQPSLSPLQRHRRLRHRSTTRTGGNDQALGAYAQAPLSAQQRRNLARQPIMSLDGRIHSPNPAFDVYDTQYRYIGSDPDPFIRNDLARNPPDRDD